MTFAGSGTLQAGVAGTLANNLTINSGVTGTFDTQANAVTLSGIISGSGALTKIGTGSLTLLGSNTYSGGTTISAGTLQLGNGVTNGSLAGNISDSSLLIFNNATVQTYGGVISGGGTLNVLGPGLLVLTASNTFSGQTTISAGTLQLSNGALTGNISDSVAGLLQRHHSDLWRRDQRRRHPECPRSRPPGACRFEHLQRPDDDLGRDLATGQRHDQRRAGGQYQR